MQTSTTETCGTSLVEGCKQLLRALISWDSAPHLADRAERMAIRLEFEHQRFGLSPDAATAVRRTVQRLCRGEITPGEVAAARETVQMAMFRVRRIPWSGQPESQSETRRNQFRRDGKAWVVDYAGVNASFTGQAGMQSIAIALARPHVETGWLELRALATGVPIELETSTEIVDRQGLREINERVIQIRADMDEADGNRREQLQAELDTLLAEVRRCSGIGGRARRSADPNKKARDAERKAVKSAIEALATAHPALAEHLRAFLVLTPSGCAYRPPGPIEWAT